MKALRSPRGSLRRAVALGAVGAALTIGVSACGGGSGGGSNKPATAASIDAALQQPTTLTMWSWAPQDKDIVAAFEKKYPKIKVNHVNVGSGTDEYTKLQNAIKAGSGAPDVAQIEYFAMPQFALEGSLANLNDLGLGGLKSDFSTAAWNGVLFNGAVEELPQDIGPMALFYNKTIFDKYHLPVPTTWAQYADDAKKLHSADPKEYITSDTGDPGFTTSMIWDAGGHAYTTSGTKNVSINLQDSGAKKFTALWSPLIQQGLLDPVQGWTDQWYQGLANGTIASLVTGAWMPVDLESGVPSGKGQWRVAPMPEWTAGTPATAMNGGSGDAILKSSKHQLAAAGFIRFMDDQEGAQISVKDGDFPDTTAELNSPSFLDTTSAYFGGQKINTVLAQAATDVLPGWSYLPYQVYANSVAPDTLGQAYTKKTTLAAALRQWQQQCVTYGKQQGFDVSSE